MRGALWVQTTLWVFKNRKKRQLPHGEGSMPINSLMCPSGLWQELSGHVWGHQGLCPLGLGHLCCLGSGSTWAAGNVLPLLRQEGLRQGRHLLAGSLLSKLGSPQAGVWLAHCLQHPSGNTALSLQWPNLAAFQAIHISRLHVTLDNPGAFSCLAPRHSSQCT